MKSIFLEYSFKTSANQRLTTINLGDYNLTFRVGEAEKIVSYANIISVRIDVYSHLWYKIYLDADGHGEIAIPNWTFSTEGKREHQSSAYSLFVRVLHHHLKDKSRADYRCGKDLGKVLVRAGIAAAVLCVISFILNYLGYRLMNPYLQSLILSVSAAAIIIIFSIKKLPKSYNPSNIPLQFLP